MSFDNQDIKFSDKSREVYHEPQLIYLWELNHQKDLSKEQYEFQPQPNWVYLRRGFRLKGRLNPPVTNRKELEFPIMLKQMTDKETKEYHLKRLYELSLKSLAKIPHLEEQNQKEKQWAERIMKGEIQ
jgi:hypothetical protein